MMSSSGREKDALMINTEDISVIEGAPSTGKTLSNKSLKRDTEFIEGLSRTDDRAFYLGASSSDSGGQPADMSSNLNKGMMLSTSHISGISSPRDEEVMTGQPKPKVVLVSFKVNNVSEIDVVKCTFNANVSLFFHWEDPTLIGKPLGKLDKLELGFDPEIMVINSLDLQETESHYRLELINTYTGAVKESRHFHGKVFLLSLDLFTFPFDCQNLSINLRSKRKDFNSVALEYFSEESTVDAHPQHEWHFHGYTAMSYTTLPKYSTTGKIYSSLHVVVQVQRHAGWFAHNVMLPFFILTIISWATYALPHSGSGSGTGYNITLLALLMSLATKLIVSDKLPKVPYRTLIDWYMDTSYFCQFISILSTTVLDWYGSSGDSSGGGDSSTLTQALFGLNVSIFVFFHLWAAQRIRLHAQDIEDWKARAQGVTGSGGGGGGGGGGDGAPSHTLGGSSRNSSSFIDTSMLYGISGDEGTSSPTLGKGRLSLYAKLGWTRAKGTNKLERFGLDQDILIEGGGSGDADDDDDDDDGEEEGHVTISGGRIVTKKDKNDDDDDDDDDGSDGGDNNSGNISPTSKAARKRMSLQKQYTHNLRRIHEYRETRPELALRLRKRGVYADYAKPQLERMIESGCLDRQVDRYKHTGAPPQAGGGDGERDSTSTTTSSSPPAVAHSATRRGSGPTLTFDAPGHVPSQR